MPACWGAILTSSQTSRACTLALQQPPYLFLVSFLKVHRPPLESSESHTPVARRWKCVRGGRLRGPAWSLQSPRRVPGSTAGDGTLPINKLLLNPTDAASLGDSCRHGFSGRPAAAAFSHRTRLQMCRLLRSCVLFVTTHFSEHSTAFLTGFEFSSTVQHNAPLCTCIASLQNRKKEVEISSNEGSVSPKSLLGGPENTTSQPELSPANMTVHDNRTDNYEVNSWTVWSEFG